MDMLHAPNGLHHEIADLIADRAATLVGLIGRPDLLPLLASSAEAVSVQIASVLTGDDPHAAAETSILLATLAHGDADTPAEWWRTPIGRAVARTVACDPGETITGAEAARMLGVSRQRVHALAAKGQLQAVGRRVLQQSVFDRLAAVPGDDD